MSITYDFSGKTVVVTGSARGIGRRIAERFYEAGANVALCSISPNGKEELMQEIAGDDRSRIMAKPVDMTQVDQIGAFFEAVVEKFGSFDILVNNAGIFTSETIETVTEADWERVMDTNLKSMIFASQWLARYNREHGAGGSIVNIASVSQRYLYPSQPAIQHQQGRRGYSYQNARTRSGPFKHPRERRGPRQRSHRLECSPVRRQTTRNRFVQQDPTRPPWHQRRYRQLRAVFGS